MIALDRRNMLVGSAALAVAASLPAPAQPAQALPAEGSARSFRLTPRPGRVPLLPAPYPETEIWGYGGQVPGLEIRVRQGDLVEVQVVNGLAQPTTVHWHGLRIANAMDGVPELTQPAIAPGESFTYSFTVPDAGTYWYHPHTLSSQQVGHGLYGPLIVEEPEPPQVVHNLLGCRWGVSFLVCVLDAQNKCTARPSGTEPVEKSCTCSADVKITRRRWGKTCYDHYKPLKLQKIRKQEG